jgi:hypothetical protein
MSNQNREVANFNFKVAHMGQNANFDIPTNVCMANFIELVKSKSYEEFGISRNSIIEVVETGQGGPNLRGEDAPALVPDKNITIRTKFNGVYTNVAFYIRVLQ